MRYPAAEKLEIIRLVEGSHLPVRRTLARIGVPVTTFYRWYDRTGSMAPRAWRIVRPDRAGSGTASPIRYGIAFWPSR
jgi:putative transposase